MLRVRSAAWMLVLALASPVTGSAASCKAPSRITPQMLSVMVDSLQVLSSEFGGVLASGPIYQRSRQSYDTALRRLRELSAPGASPGLRTVLRLEDLRTPVGTPSARQSLDAVENFNGTWVQPYVRVHDSDRLASLLEPSMAILDSESVVALTRSETRLANYQRKFGPHSVPLNPVEVGLYYAIFQRVPGFGPSAECGPGPWEVVASYSPVYTTFSNKSVVTTSVLEGGLRHYLFGPGWGHDGLGGLLRPAYYSLGVAVGPEQNLAMTSPLKGLERVGGFVAWGDMKLAVLGGPHPQLLVSRQLQFIRNVF